MIFSTEIMIAATVYVRADSAEQAAKLASSLIGSGIELPEGFMGDVEISGQHLTDPLLPDVSLSPAMTVHRLFDVAHIELAAD